MKSLRKDINKRMSEYDADLRNMGLSLLNPEEQHRLLSNIWEDMMHTTRQAVDGTLRDPIFFGVENFESDPARFLRGKIREENKTLHQEMKGKGHKFEYGWRPEDGLPETVDQVPKLYRFIVGTVGTELPGNIDPHRLNHLFIDYSKPWIDIAREYLDQTNHHTREFVKFVVNDKLARQFPEIADRFREYVLEGRLEEQRRTAETELSKIESDRYGDVITEDHRFLEEKAKIYELRQARRVAQADTDGSSDDLQSQTKHSALQIIDDMFIYYDVSMALTGLMGC
jgi:hypothetical protein